MNHNDITENRMFASVVTDITHRALDRVFTYAVPSHLISDMAIGLKVEIPFGPRTIAGYVVKLCETTDYEGPIQSIHKIIRKDLQLSTEMIELAYWLADESFVSLAKALQTIFPNVGVGQPNIDEMLVDLTNKGREIIPSLRASKTKDLLVYLEQHPNQVMGRLKKEFDISQHVLRRVTDNEWISLKQKKKEFSVIKSCSLNRKQQQVVDNIDKQAQQGKRRFLIHGVTGSGKTEVYFSLIEKCIKQKKQALVLFPEISLTQEMIGRFKKVFGNRVRPWHSQMSRARKKHIWEEMNNQQADVLIGPRSAVFVGMQNLGLIIIDEEHDSSYQQNTTPCYDGRNVANKRCDMSDALLVLGSATPSVETLYQVKQGQIIRYELMERFSGASLPQIEIIDMRAELKKGNYHMFSQRLQALMAENIEKKRGILLFINRRGYSGSYVCRDCGHTIYCAHCDIPMTYHLKNDELKCHYCGYRKSPPQACPKCKSKRIRSFGVGTQKIEKEAKLLFPRSVVARIDGDISIRSGERKRLIEKLKHKEIDILIGTQIITKGIDFPSVGLVAVVSADLALNLPDFRAREKTTQQLIQVAGRAGRVHGDGVCLIQTYQPDDAAIVFAKESEYNTFVEMELLQRKQMHYPPYAQTIRILMRSEDEEWLVQQAVTFAANMPKTNLRVLGPVPASYTKIRNLYRWHIIVLGDNLKMMKELVQTSLKIFYANENTSRIQFTVEINPSSML